MSSETTYTIEGLPRRDEARPARTGGGRLVAIFLGILVLALLAFNVTLWLAASGRSQAAVRRVKADAEAYRAAWSASQTPAQPAGKPGRKKSPKKKPAAGPAARGLWSVAPLPMGKASLADLRQQNQDLDEELASLAPAGLYIVIDTANNRFYLKKRSETILDTDCSTGSYARLKAPDGRTWFFHTPRGLFKVESKKKDPVWVKPDWAFVEEQKPIPGARHPDRYDSNVMGDYALGFGHGYYIHGTLYQRFLRQSVTHGCVRLGDAALKQVYETAGLGTPVFIY